VLRLQQRPRLSVFSIPMHITKDMKITSDITITIQRLTGDEDPTMWSLEPVFKSVPKALWGACDCSFHLSHILSED
jgi:hypothetical protein